MRSVLRGMGVQITSETHQGLGEQHRLSVKMQASILTNDMNLT